MRRRLVPCVLGVVVALTGVLAPAAQAHEGKPGKFSCRASGVALTLLGTELIPPTPVSNPPQVPCANDFDQVFTLPVEPLVTVDVITTRTTSGAPTFGAATAQTVGAVATVPGLTVTADVISSKARSACSTLHGGPILTGSSKITGLTLNGSPVNVTGQKNQTINVSPLVVVVINEQIKTADTITVRAIHVYSPLLSTDLVISESIADVERCGFGD